MIVTRKRQVPFLWILLAVLPWSGYGFAGGAMNNAFLFSLKKYVENPSGLTFILTLPGYTSIVTFPFCSFMSDRIWTRFGRRKPFIVTAWVGMMTALVLMPFTTTLWSLVLLYVLFSVSSDVAAPLEPLKQEIVPPHQRGLSTAIMTWLGNAGGLLFAFVAIGRFDDVRYMGGYLVVGETLLYWAGGLVLFVTFFILTLGIRETNPHHVPRDKLSLKTFFAAILDKDLWPVYMITFGASMLASSLGPLGNLLYTDQWNYTKQDMGTNIAVGGVLNVFIIGGLAFIADRLDRMKAYQILITLSLVIQVLYYFYVEYLLPDRHPSLIEIIVFGETLSILGILTTLIYIPLVYDYVVRDKMGTYLAGAGLLGRVTGIITLNAIGLFVWGYSLLFQPPAGDMTRICLAEKADQRQIDRLVQEARFHEPEANGPVAPAKLSARAWYANGVMRKEGTCWEVRLSDKKSEDLTAAIESLQSQLAPLLARVQTLKDDAQIASLQHHPEAAQSALQEVADQTKSIDALNAKLAPLQAELDSRARDFQQQVAADLKSRMMPDGAQIQDARVQSALVVELAASAKPSAALEKTLVDLRREDPSVVDLRSSRFGDRFAVSVSSLLAPGTDQKARAEQLAASVVRLAAIRQRDLFPGPPEVLSQNVENALILKLRIVEDPLDNHPSPITRVVNHVLGWFDCAPQPEHRLAATARSLRLKDESEHVGIQAGSAVEHVMTVAVLLLPAAEQVAQQDAVTTRLQTLLGPTQSAPTVGQVRAFYDRLVDAAGAQNLTVERPLLTSGYVPLKYNYVSGYIPIFFLALVGLLITFAFGRRERQGLIRKLGVEEAEGI